MQDGMTHYTSSRGALDLRRAAAAKLLRDDGVTRDAETEILVTHGGIHAYYVGLQSILNPGDEVLIPDPSWATHTNMVTMLRGRAVRVPAPAELEFIPAMEAWEKALTPQTRAIVLNYPSNPTGAYPSRAYMQSLYRFAQAHDLWIVSDEVYGSLYYSERPTSVGVFEDVSERTLLVHSLSKSYAMTGWRVGFLAAPQRVIENALKAGQNSITCVAPFIQKAAAFALTDPSMQEVTAKMREAYARRRSLVMRVASERESDRVRVIPPQGAFYFFLDFRAMKMPSLELCNRLLDEAGVALVPGSAFGEQGEGFARLCIAASDADVEAGMNAIFDWAERV
jgi:aspartate/methionine/tyrosine aminotransferase